MPFLEGMPEFGKIELEYRLYLKSRRKIDVNNVLTVVDKYFQDCIVDAGIIKDDNYKYIQRTEFLYGGHMPLEDDSFVMVTIKGV